MFSKLTYTKTRWKPGDRERVIIFATASAMFFADAHRFCTCHDFHGAYRCSRSRTEACTPDTARLKSTWLRGSTPPREAARRCELTKNLAAEVPFCPASNDVSSADWPFDFGSTLVPVELVGSNGTVLDAFGERTIFHLSLPTNNEENIPLKRTLNVLGEAAKLPKDGGPLLFATAKVVATNIGIDQTL